MKRDRDSVPQHERSPWKLPPESRYGRVPLTLDNLARIEKELLDIEMIEMEDPKQSELVNKALKILKEVFSKIDGRIHQEAGRVRQTLENEMSSLKTQREYAVGAGAGSALWLIVLMIAVASYADDKNSQELKNTLGFALVSLVFAIISASAYRYLGRKSKQVKANIDGITVFQYSPQVTHVPDLILDGFLSDVSLEDLATLWGASNYIRNTLGNSFVTAALDLVLAANEKRILDALIAFIANPAEASA